MSRALVPLALILIAGACRTAAPEAVPAPEVPPLTASLSRVTVPVVLPPPPPDDVHGGPGAWFGKIEELRVVLWEAVPDGPSRRAGEAARPIFPGDLDGSTVEMEVTLARALAPDAEVFAVADIHNTRQHVHADSGVPRVPTILRARMPTLRLEAGDARAVPDPDAPTTYIDCAGDLWSVWEFKDAGAAEYGLAQLEYRGEREFGLDSMHRTLRVPSVTGRQYSERNWGEDADLWMGPDGARLSLGNGPWTECSIAQRALAPDHPLVGRWRVVTLAGRPPVDGTEPDIEVRADLGLGANAGCNGGGGQFRLDADRLVVSSFAQTLRGCGELAAQEGAMFGLLSSGPVWRVDGDRLTLSMEDGTTLTARRMPDR